MEHVTIKEMGANVRLIPDVGYKLADKFGNQYSEVICKQSEICGFSVIEVPAEPENGKE